MKGLKIGVLVSFIVSMGVLLLGGYFAKNEVAPYPERIAVNEEVIILNHYSNFQPLCSKINRDIKKNNL
jgi:hypothetical protein